VDPLHCMEIPRIEQPPRSEKCLSLGPDRTGVIEGKREIEEKEGFWIQSQPP
jgi:hypothetical protein